MNIYVIGSLRNPEVPRVSARLREAGHVVFDDWYAAGPNADDHWRDYEKGRGHSFVEALDGLAADHVFQFDFDHLVACDAGLLVLPAGKSGHMEFGWVLGQGKVGLVLVDDPERYDVMYKLASGVFDSVDKLIEHLAVAVGDKPPKDFWTVHDDIKMVEFDIDNLCECHGMSV